MSENSKIEWCDHTFNPWEGCTKVSPGCMNCYAETRNARWNGGTAPNWGKGKPRRRTIEENWRKPKKWNKDASEAPDHPRVFCASLADWLDDEVPIEWLADLLQLIHETPCLDWLLLTKRPENWSERIHQSLAHVEGIQGDWPSRGPDSELGEWLNDWTGDEPPHNVWIGTTVEDQQRANERIPLLLSIPAKVRFLSVEPMLEYINLGMGATYDKAWDGVSYSATSARMHAYDTRGEKIHWVICGGESGNGCRPFESEWAQSLRYQCAESEVPFFMKQMGGRSKPFAPIPDDLMIREFPKGARHERNKGGVG